VGEDLTLGPSDLVLIPHLWFTSWETSIKTPLSDWSYVVVFYYLRSNAQSSDESSRDNNCSARVLRGSNKEELGRHFVSSEKCYVKVKNVNLLPQVTYVVRRNCSFKG
jgi:hypothetical protein